MLTGVVAPISTVKQLHGTRENGSNRSQEKTLDVLCCVIVFYTGAVWSFGDTHFNFCNTHTETERDQHSQTTRIQSNVKIVTTAVNQLSTADAKNSLLSPVSTPFSTN